jgi:uncharacterized protein (TIGR02268 family)
MPPYSPPFLLVLALLQGSPVVEPLPAAVCEDMRRIELSRSPTRGEREICVSPGFLTGLLFDAPVSVELQDEVRFVEVTRGRSGISFVPPRELVEGERLRLTARFMDGASQEAIAFTLVAQSGRATHQVEVFRDRRTRESLQQEVAQERAKQQRLSEENQRLREELERMRAHLEQGVGLRGVIISGAMGPEGVAARPLTGLDERPERELLVTRGICYRSGGRAAAAVWVTNSGTEPWTVVGASLVVNGEPMKGLIWQGETIAAGETGVVVVEVVGAGESLRGDATLSLWEAGPRVIHIPQVTFP